jgi:hypothetical protein
LSDRQKTSDSDPNSLWTAVSLAVFFILTFVVVIALQALFFRWKDSEFDRKVVERLPAELTEMKEEQLSQLSAYRWVDKEAGVAAVPIDRAMELVMDEENRKEAAR